MAETEDVAGEPEESTELPARVEEDEDDNLSDWTVPSWTELIASLYRPER
jgi:hypothetical protein